MQKQHRYPLTVCHLTSVHPSFDTRIFHKECRTLVMAGYRVYLVAPHEREEVIQDVHIIPIPKRNGRKQRMTLSVWDVFRRALQINADIYHFHDPELIPVGLLLRSKGKRVIYDVHEDYPKQHLSKTWIPKPLRSMIAKGTAWMETLASCYADGIVAATPVIGRKFPPNKTVTVQNFPTLKDNHNNDNVPYSHRIHRIVYVGQFAVIRGMKEMIQAIELVPDKWAVQLTLAGTPDVPSLLNDIQQMPGWTRVDYRGWRAREEVEDILATSRIGLVLFHPLPNHIAAQPNKLFEYMAAGLPVVASNFSLWRDIVNGVGCGLLVDPLNPQEIADAIEYLLTHPDEAYEMGQRGRQAVEDTYNWSKEEEKLLKLYARLSQSVQGQ